MVRNPIFKLLLAAVACLATLSFYNSPDNTSSAGNTLLLDPAVVAANYPKDYFQMPVTAGLRLSGTFGELRPNHFHAGLDLSSPTGRIGAPVLAAADGYVERVQVQAGGYGNSIRIRHPNGYTTLYGHLDRFAPEIAAYVKAQQYAREKFEVELALPASKFPVRQGEEIGKMGNTGSSSGPHLHFEIRHTATDKTANPLLFGLGVPDQTAPEPRDMKVYFLDERRQVLMGKPLPIRRRADGSYGPASGDTLLLGAWRVGFGLKAYDRSDGNLRNDNGLYALELSADENSVFQWRMDELDPDEARYLNAHADFAARSRYGAWFHRCFVLPGDRLSNYAQTGSMGAVSLFKDRAVKINLKAIDAAGNASEVSFWAIRDADHMETPTATDYQYELPFDSDSRIEAGDLSLFMPKGALYEDLHFEYKITPDQSTGLYSDMHHLHDPATPLHRYFDVGIKPRAIPESLRSKAIIARCGVGRPDNCGGSWQGDRLTAKVREFGDYCVLLDTEAPTITPIVFGPTRRNRKPTGLSFRIRDNYPASDSAGGMTYTATVDGKWTLFAYDRKSARITHTYDERIGPGKHLLKLTVRDDRGNVGVFEKEFVR